MSQLRRLVRGGEGGLGQPGRLEVEKEATAHPILGWLFQDINTNPLVFWANRYLADRIIFILRNNMVIKMNAYVFIVLLF